MASSDTRTLGLKIATWLWLGVGLSMLVLITRRWTLDTPTLAISALGMLDIGASGLLLLRKRSGRILLTVTMIGHLAFAVWLLYQGQAMLPDEAIPAKQMTYDEMVDHTVAKRMIGATVFLFRALFALTLLLCSWTAVELYRSR